MEKERLQEMYRMVNEKCSHYQRRYLNSDKTLREYERSRQQYLYHKRLAKHYEHLLERDF